MPDVESNKCAISKGCLTIKSLDIFDTNRDPTGFSSILNFLVNSTIIEIFLVTSHLSSLKYYSLLMNSSLFLDFQYISFIYLEIYQHHSKYNQ